MSSILSGLNPEQLEAVSLPHQSALILAGAGSGKTRVLTTRIAYLIQSGQASPHGVLAVTFTNKAAKEMIARLSAMLPINTRGMWIGTFHGLCNRMLRLHHRDAGLPQLFQILDVQDQLSLVKRVMKAMGVDGEKFPPRQVQWFINGNKEAGLRASKVEAYDDFSRRMTEVYAAYDEQCSREGVVDFAELLLRCFELLQANEILRDHYRERFAHILVDEFQDTNRLQYLWLRLLAGNRCAVMAVGDDDQSIYGFRGAHSANMQSFERDFGVAKVIKLEQNYRSHGNILDAANHLIRNNRTRLGKNLWTAESHGEPLRVFQAPTDLDEAAYVVDEVKALSREGVALSEIAVLYRSNAQSRVLEHALFNAGLPYRVYGGLRFFERQEIKHALAYLRLAANPDDDNALLRVINFPARGIGARSLEQLQESAKAAGGSLWQAACERSAVGGQPVGRALPVDPRPATTGRPASSPLKGIPAFVALIESLRAATQGLPLPEIVEHMVEHSGLKQHYQSEREGADRLENLNELVNAAVGFVHEAEDDSLPAFLAHAALEAGEHQAEEGAQALQLMTVHSAKGLEFHGVFITGLEEGLFPHEQSFNQDGGLEEERRLMYVALTRSKRRLYLTFAQSRMLHGQTRYNVSSRFLEEIPERLMKWVNLTAPFAPVLVPEPKPKSKSAVSFTVPKASHGWQVGQSVTHPKFGSGVIVNCEGHGPDARVQVRFTRAGVKWLALEYARLTPA
ncbi:MAG: UvrD-helicase domain-containing protein [Betaproteobacteria bacterium]|nr:UvrD-helicase domain-containing protein [Betaproteobacteria bacterium]